MTTILQRPPSRANGAEADPARGDQEQDIERLLAEIEHGSGAAERAALRHERAERLAASAAGDRQPLEDLRARYLHRLHRASDDFPATEGLRTVELALRMTPRPEGRWAWQQEEQHRSRRWWRRRRGQRR